MKFYMHKTLADRMIEIQSHCLDDQEPSLKQHIIISLLALAGLGFLAYLISKWLP